MENQRLRRFKEHPALVGESWDWFRRSLDKRALSTQEGYLDKFTRFLEWLGWDTEALFKAQLENIREAREGDPRATKRMPGKLADFQTYLMEKEGLKSGSVQDVYRSVSLFFLANKLEFEASEERISDEDTEEIPIITREQLIDVFNASGSYKYKTIIMFLKDSGLRIGDVANLKVGDLKTAHYSEDRQYCTFEIKTQKTGTYANPVIGPETLEWLDRWNTWREKKGIPTNDEDPLFCSTKRRAEYIRKDGVKIKETKLGGFMDESAIGVVFGEYVKKAGLEKAGISAHSCRKYHKTYLEAGGCPTSWINKMQGRKGEGTGGIYTKPEPEQLINMYKKGYGELRLFGKEDTDKKLASVLATTARGLGASEDKIKQIMEMLDVGRMTLEQFQKEISEIISETQKSDKNKVMVIDEKDIENHLNHGWTFVGLTPSGRCIIKQSL
jgi:integrase